MNKWELEKPPELIPVLIDPRHYKQIVAEISELLLDSHRQLRQKNLTHPTGAVPAMPKATKSQKAEKDTSRENI